MTATPPLSFARRSCSFSLLYSTGSCSTRSRRRSTRSFTAVASPPPFSSTVSSFVTVTFLTEPRMEGSKFSESNSSPVPSSPTSCAPVKMDIS
uniref:Uncharacterized protein n=1 Tax=Leishmania guyanensis TaxID=5670 RepID=A0A1E1J9I4_LEIGU|nr:Hypothetical protein BN36_NA77890 [Leishmania guyanensis]